MAINLPLYALEGERGRIYGNEPYIFTVDVYYAPGKYKDVAAGAVIQARQDGIILLSWKIFWAFHFLLAMLSCRHRRRMLIGDYLVSLPTRAGRVDIAVRYEGTTQATNALESEAVETILYARRIGNPYPRRGRRHWTIINVKN